MTSNVELDYVLTPLLYCDSSGNRVGYGKGFYDQFFSEYPNINKKIGLNFFPPNEIITDVYEKDVQLDAVITPNQIFKF
ncbi:5-formyltetrahydrofolate cyclo-ligase family protein [compost metagenome]